MPTNKAIVGENAFAHEAGIHQHGVLENPATYEILRPEDVGLDRNRLVLGKHSGRRALQQRVADLGFDLDGDTLARLLADFKTLADKKKQVYDADIEALATAIVGQQSGTWSIRGLQLTIGTNSIPTASIVLANRNGNEVCEAAVGDGPIDAVFKALSHATRVRPELRQYRVRSVTDGEDAQGEVAIDVTHEGRRYHGRGVNTDIIHASTEAFLDVINRITRFRATAAMAAAHARWLTNRNTRLPLRQCVRPCRRRSDERRRCTAHPVRKGLGRTRRFTRAMACRQCFTSICIWCMR